MILDSSAIVTVLLEETGYQVFFKKMERTTCAVGAPTLLEVAIVLRNRLRDDAREMIDGFLDAFEVEVIPFGTSHLSVAIQGFNDYGKGRHPAKLNFGDCLTYAVAKVAGEPLLFKGNDFSQTDLLAA
jgi:ribonuclease VapC